MISPDGTLISASTAPYWGVIAIEENGGDKRLVQLELALEAHGVASSEPVNLAFAAAAEAILMRIFVEQVPSLHMGCCKVLETGHLLQLLAVQASICTDLIHAVGDERSS